MKRVRMIAALLLGVILLMAAPLGALADAVQETAGQQRWGSDDFNYDGQITWGPAVNDWGDALEEVPIDSTLALVWETPDGKAPAQGLVGEEFVLRAVWNVGRSTTKVRREDIVYSWSVPQDRQSFTRIDPLYGSGGSYWKVCFSFADWGKHAITLTATTKNGAPQFGRTKQAKTTAEVAASFYACSPDPAPVGTGFELHSVKRWLDAEGTDQTEDPCDDFDVPGYDSHLEYCLVRASHYNVQPFTEAEFARAESELDRTVYPPVFTPSQPGRYYWELSMPGRPGVDSLSCVTATGDVSWGDGPEVIVDSSADYTQCSLRFARNGRDIPYDDEAPIAVLAGEELIGSVVWVAPPSEAASADHSIPRDTETYSWWVQRYHKGDTDSEEYEDKDTLWEYEPLAGIPGQYYKAGIHFSVPGRPILRMDQRTYYVDDLGSVRDPCWAPPVYVYGFEAAKDQITAQTGGAVPLPLQWITPDLRTVARDSAEGRQIFTGETLQADVEAVHPNGMPFSADELAEVRSTFTDTNGLPQFTPAEAGTYTWTIVPADRPTAYPAVFTVAVSGEGETPAPAGSAVAVRENPWFDLREADGQAYLVQKTDSPDITQARPEEYLDIPADANVSISADPIKTGTTVTVTDSSGTGTASFVILGDLGRQGIANLTTAAKALAGQPLTPPLLWAADFNDNGKVDIADITKLAQHLFHTDAGSQQPQPTIPPQATAEPAPAPSAPATDPSIVQGPLQAQEGDYVLVYGKPYAFEVKSNGWLEPYFMVGWLPIVLEPLPVESEDDDYVMVGGQKYPYMRPRLEDGSYAAFRYIVPYQEIGGEKVPIMVLAPGAQPSATQTPAPSTPSKPLGSFDENGFIFPQSSTEILSAAELNKLTLEQLGFARNEIFARNGNLFRSQKYIDHYTQYAWYNDLPNKRYDIQPTELNQIEQQNIILILAAEEMKRTNGER